jgi:adenylate cyclase
MTYKGKAVDVREIGKELGVQYVLEGSVQPTSNRIRVNAQLIDAESGSHLWADTFDTDKSDLLQAEDKIVTRLARSLNLEVMYSEVAQAERVQPANLDAEDLALRCKAAFIRRQHAFGKEGVAGHSLCEQALVIDPNNVDALTTLSWAVTDRVVGAQSTDRKSDIKRANELVSRALQIDMNNPRAHGAKSFLLYAQRRFDEAQEEAERAIALDPSDVDARQPLCLAFYGKAQPDNIISCVDAVIRISPQDPSLWASLFDKGTAYLMMGKNDAALEPFRQTAELNPDFPLAQVYLAATAALVGQDEEAHEALARYLSLPGTNSKTIAALKKQTISANPTYLAMRERVYEGLRKAGMPEQ